MSMGNMGRSREAARLDEGKTKPGVGECRACDNRGGEVEQIWIMVQQTWGWPRVRDSCHDRYHCT
jgi:hypothetical protein